MPPPVVRLPTIPSLTWDDCRLLVESVVDYAIFMLDTEGHVATWNAGAEKIKGYRAEEIIGEHFSRFYPEVDIAAGKPAWELEEAAKVGRIEDEGWRLRKDGSRFWANVIITALRDASGTLRGFGKVTRDLTNRRGAEEELRRSEERFRLLIENIGDYAIYMLDQEGRVATWNLGAQRLKGYSASEIVGRNFSVFFPAEDVAAGKPERELQEARQKGRFEDEGFRVRKDGTRFWANAILSAVHDAHGNLLGFAKITRDLTVRREAEENERRLIQERTARAVAEHGEKMLRESEERYRALSLRLEIVLEGVADGITVQDRQGNLIFANSAAARLCGFASVDELLRATPESFLNRFEMLDEDGRPFLPENLPGRRVLAGEQTASALVHVHELWSGKHWWSLIRARAVLAGDGAPELAVNIWHDVTREHRKERDTRYIADATTALSSSVQPDELLTAFAEVLVPNLADWCSVYVLEGESLRNVVSVHADREKLPFARDYQHRFPPDPNKPGVWNVVRTGMPELYSDVSDELLAASASSAEQLAVLRSVGMKSVAVAPILRRSRVLGAISIISAESARRYDHSHLELLMELGERAGIALEHAELFRAAKAAAAAAEEASRAKDEFLATVSHELRTPLNAILGWSTILRDRISDPNLVRPIESIHRNALAQVRIIEDILDVSRVITGKFQIDPRAVDLLEVARQATEVVRASAVAKSVKLVLDFEHDHCHLFADPDRLQQVIWNLLSNAVKFTPSGGTVMLAIHQIDAQVELRVSDTGIGIDPSFLPYVFDRFRQADPSTTRRVGGLGLGLALVRHIVELHGGTVEAASTGRGTGATFTIRLPIRAVAEPVSERPPAAESSKPPAVRGDLNGIRVLVIDDEVDAREVISVVLENAGATVCTAASAAEGLAEFARFEPDVVLSDIAMPGEDGYTFIQKLRSLPLGKDVPALALTAFVRQADRTRAFQAGFNGHLRKPIAPDALVGAVADAVRRSVKSSAD